MQQQLNRAEPLYLRALRIWEKSLPAGEARIRLAVENLAVLYTRQGKQAQAKAFHERLQRMGGQSSEQIAEIGRGSLYTVPLEDLLKQTPGRFGFGARGR
jgi:hypothetical protein